MRASISLLGAALAALPAAAQHMPVKIFSNWGVIQEPEARKCYARTRVQGPEQKIGAASVVYWPAKGVRGQIHFRMSSPVRQGSAILLRIDDGSYQLVGSGDNAWARDNQANAAIVQAMRTGTSMTIESRNLNGRWFRDRYALAGAATAVDAAAIACVRR